MEKVKIKIIYGGNSSEREISKLTGISVFNALEELYDVELIDVVGSIENYLFELKKADLIFNALHGGEGENGIIQSFLEKNKIKFTGSNSYSSSIAINKHLTKRVAKSNGISTPNWLLSELTKFEENIDNIKELKLPLVIKPVDEGSTMGLRVVENYNEIKNAFLYASKYSDSVIIEEFISGREMTVGILGDNCLPILEIIPKNKLYDYESKYTQGMSEYICPVKLNDVIKEKMQRDAIKIHKLLGCRHYSRVDFRVSENNQYSFLEINTLPGMTKTSLLPKAAKANNIPFEELIKKIIEMAIK